MAESMLTQGILPKVQASASSDELPSPPVVQVIDLRMISRQQHQEQRCKLVISDGNNSHTAMLATQLNSLVTEQQLKQGSIVCLHEYMCNAVQKKRVIIVLNCTVAGNWHETIGSPTPLDEHIADGSAPMPAAPPQQQPHAPPHAQPAGGYGTGGAHPISPKHAYGNAYSGVTSYGQDRQQPSHAGMDQGPTRQFYQAQGGPTAKNQAPPQITPVKMLNPYQGRWTIEVRVTAVGSIKTFSKQGSTGRVQNYDVVDAHKDEIRCVAFNETIDHFSSLFEKGKTLRISKGSLVQANPKFNNLNTDYEIRLDKNSVVEEMSDQGSIPSMSFNFRSIADLEHTEVGVTIDIIGIATSARDVADIVRKDGSQTKKRDVTLVDNSGSGIDCTLWDRFADNEGGQIQERLNTEAKKPIVAIKACRVGSFGGTSLNSSANSVIVINPDLQEAKQLASLQDAEDTGARMLTGTGGGGGSTKRTVSIEQLRRETSEKSNMPISVTVSAWIAKINSMRGDRLVTYPACNEINESTGRTCGKKMNYDEVSQHFKCDRHSDQAKSDPEYRYMMSIDILDTTSQLTPTLIGDAGESLFKMPADDFHQKEDDDLAETDRLKRDMQFRRINLRLRASTQTFNDEERIKYNIQGVDPLDWTKETRTLLQNLVLLERGENIEQPPPAPAPAPAPAPKAQTQSQLPIGGGIGGGGFDAMGGAGAGASGQKPKGGGDMCFKCGT